MARSPDELKKLQDVVADVLEEIAGVPAADIQADKSLVDDLDVDSLALVEIMVEFEQRLGVSVPDDVAKTLKTVGDIVAYLDSHSA